MTSLSELREQIREIREEGVPNFDGIEGKVLGICSTCIHSANCEYMKNSYQAVFHCEEFETEQPKKEVSARTAEAKVPEKPTTLKGLCMNCENRHDCKLNKPEEGIWHCEEYR